MAARKGVEAPEFWDAAEPFLADDGTEEGTLMGFPCLRADGEFFAMPKHDSGELVCKLPSERVQELIADGSGAPFGPGEKVFKEWVLVGMAHEARWPALMAEARIFVTS